MKSRNILITAGALTAFSLSSLTAQQTGQGQPQTGQPGIEQPRAGQDAQPGQPGMQQRQTQPGMQERQPGQPGIHDQQRTQQDQAASSQFDAVRISDLNGSRVVNANGDRLGTVDDIAIQLEDGTFQYAIISAGGFLGIGGDLRPVPPQALQTREVTMGLEVVLDITEEQWDNAPTIDREQIHTLAQDTRGQQIYQFYGQDWDARQDRSTEFAAPGRDREHQDTQLEGDRHDEIDVQERDDEVDQDEFGSPTRERATDQQRPGTHPGATPQQQGAMRDQTTRDQATRDQSDGFGLSEDSLRPASELNLAGDLINADLQNQQQEELGEITDFLVNLEEGQVVFALVSTATGFWDMGDEEFAVSPAAFDIQGDHVILNVSQQDLETAQIITRDQLQAQAREQAGVSPDEARQSPQVFRYQDTTGTGPGVFGEPGRDRDAQTEEVDTEHDTGIGPQGAGTEGSPGVGAGTTDRDRDTEYGSPNRERSPEFGSPDRREAEREEVRRELGIQTPGETEGRQYPDRQEHRMPQGGGR